MAKRGRKKKNTKRMPCGRINQRAVTREAVEPTAALIAKRIAALAIAGVYDASKLNLAESWLGVCHAAGWINEAEYAAGLKFHNLYRYCYPQGFAQTNFLAVRQGEGDLQPHEPISDKALEEIEMALGAAQRILKELGDGRGQPGNRTYSIVRNVAVYGRFMPFMDTQTKRPELSWKKDQYERTLLVGGLNALARAFGYGTEPQSAERMAA
jgi:hypothetical protein